jgi:sugar phosphate isomerase/epimerase
MTVVSTSFFPLQSRRAVDQLAACLRELAVPEVELDYRLSAARLADLMASLRRTGIRVASVHNFCPIPPDFEGQGGGGDLFSLADTDREARLEAVKWTCRSLETAHAAEARVVVLHGGLVTMEAACHRIYAPNPSGPTLTDSQRTLLQRKLAVRDRLKPPHLDALCFSLDRLLPRAEKYDLCLGLENRFHYHELPGPEDLTRLLAKFAGAPLGYWHDTGHAWVAEKMGLLRTDELLTRFRESLLGVHLHDARGVVDHLPPGEGDIDFAALTPLIPEGVLRVLELRPQTTTAALAAGIRHLQAAGLGAPPDGNDGHPS